MLARKERLNEIEKLDRVLCFVNSYKNSTGSRLHYKYSIINCYCWYCILHITIIKSKNFSSDRKIMRFWCYNKRKGAPYSNFLQKNCLNVLKTAVRSSRSRQQYKIGLMEEFRKIAVFANFQALFQLSRDKL